MSGAGFGCRVAVAALVLTTDARAQDRPAARDPAAAEALFKTAIEALDRGDWAGACPKFDASMKLDPSPSTLLNIAKCHAHDAKLALAWAECQRALVLNGETQGAQRQAELDGYTRKLIAELEARLPKLRVAIANAPAGVAVTRDGLELPAGMIGEAVPIDPGVHEIVVSAPGFRTERRSVTVADGQSAELELALVRGGDPLVKPPASGAPGADGEGGIPAWAWIAGGVGALCIAGSVVFLVDQSSTQSTINRRCSGPGNTCGSFDPASDNARLNRDFGLFLGLGIAGVAGVGVAAFGILTAPPKRSAAHTTSVRPAAWLLPGGAGAALEGVL